MFNTVPFLFFKRLAFSQVMECIITGSTAQSAALSGAAPDQLEAAKNTAMELLQKRFSSKEGGGIRIYKPDPRGGNSNSGNCARRFFSKPSVTAKILNCPVELISNVQYLLHAYNSTDYQNIALFKDKARLVHRLWRESLGQYRLLTQSFHSLLAHGHLFLTYAQRDLKVALGELTEASTERANKRNKEADMFFSRKNSLKNRLQDVTTRQLAMSDPHLLACQDMQVRATGRIGRGRGRGVGSGH